MSSCSSLLKHGVMFLAFSLIQRRNLYQVTNDLVPHVHTGAFQGPYEVFYNCSFLERLCVGFSFSFLPVFFFLKNNLVPYARRSRGHMFLRCMFLSWSWILIKFLLLLVCFKSQDFHFLKKQQNSWCVSKCMEKNYCNPICPNNMYHTDM